MLLDFVGDGSSLDCCTLLETLNPPYKPTKRKIAAAPLRCFVRRVRVCAAQYIMRTIRFWHDFAQNVAFFVETADEYNCHFLLLPAFLITQLFSTMRPDLDSRQAMRELAEMTPTEHVYIQDELHITPAECGYFDIHPGERIDVFETPLGRRGVKVCYDI